MSSSWTIGRKITVGFLLCLFTMFIIGLVAYLSVDELIDSSMAVRRATNIQTKITQVLSQMKDAETGERGYVITGEDEYLEPYTSGSAAMATSVKELRDIYSQEQENLDLLNAAETHIKAKLEELKAVIDVRRSGGFEPALKTVKEGRGKADMDAIRKILGEMDEKELVQLEKLGRLAHTASYNAKSTVIVGTSLAVILVLVTAFLIIRSTTLQVGSAVSDMESASAELQAASQQQATGAKEQATAMNEIATTINELLATSRQISDSSQRVAQVADKTANAARAGDATVIKARESVGSIQRQVDLIVTHMLELGRKSQQIGSVLDLVNELSEQTNILAINATIEAAGAGESGKRFSVVADEIRKLADRVGGSTKEIRTLIDEVRAAVNTTVMVTEAGSKAVESGTRHVIEVASSFAAITALVETTTSSAKEIGLSTKQQTTAVEQVNAAMANISQAARESEASTSQTLQTASQLAHLSRGLNSLIRTS